MMVTRKSLTQVQKHHKLERKFMWTTSGPYGSSSDLELGMKMESLS